MQMPEEKFIYVAFQKNTYIIINVNQFFFKSKQF